MITTIHAVHTINVFIRIVLDSPWQVRLFYVEWRRLSATPSSSHHGRPAMGYTVPMHEENRNPPKTAERRRFLDGVRASPTVIGAGTVVVGDLRGPGPFFVSGEIHGDGDVLGDLHVAVSGSWHGHVHARRAIVAGRMTGSLRVEDKLEIGHTAVIRGNVSAARIAIAKGAVIEGEIEVTSGGSMQPFEEKRSE